MADEYISIIFVILGLTILLIIISTPGIQYFGSVIAGILVGLGIGDVVKWMKS